MTTNEGISFKYLPAIMAARMEAAETRYLEEQATGDAVSVASTRATFLAWRDAAALVRSTTHTDARDYFATHETLSDCDQPDASIAMELAISLAGPAPDGGWKGENKLAMLRWEARWRAALRYIRADAMLAERAKGGKTL